MALGLYKRGGGGIYAEQHSLLFFIRLIRHCVYEKPAVSKYMYRNIYISKVLKKIPSNRLVSMKETSLIGNKHPRICQF